MKSWSTVGNPTSWMQFNWDDENRLLRTTEGISATDPDKVTQYTYDDAGKRIVKRSDTAEVVYVNDNFTVRNKDAISKHIFAGNTRVATVLKTSSGDDVFFYHGDHLGSSNIITKDEGLFNESIEYLPYGETWVEENAPDAEYTTPYRFTSKEQDEETGLYYFGARYYDPKLGRWISADQALNKFIPENGNKNKLLPGLGGCYNFKNLDVYGYAHNNPIILIDPDGNQAIYIPGIPGPGDVFNQFRQVFEYGGDSVISGFYSGAVPFINSESLWQSKGYGGEWKGLYNLGYIAGNIWGIGMQAITIAGLSSTLANSALFNRYLAADLANDFNITNSLMNFINGLVPSSPILFSVDNNLTWWGAASLLTGGFISWQFDVVDYFISGETFFDGGYDYGESYIDTWCDFGY